MKTLKIMTDPNDSDRAIAIYQKSDFNNNQSRVDLVDVVLQVLGICTEDVDITIENPNGDFVKFQHGDTPQETVDNVRRNLSI